MQVSFNGTDEEKVRELIASGQYSDAAEVVSAAVRHLHERTLSETNGGTSPSLKPFADTQARDAGVDEHGMQRGPRRDILDGSVIPEGESLYDHLKASGLVGCIKDLPPDLATNPKYMEGFGES